MLLAEADGLLDRDDRLVRHVPDLAALAPDVTLRHLLHHTSGLPDYVPLLFDAGRGLHDTTTPAEALAALAAARPERAPGVRFAYSNANYFLLSLCLERASGRSLAAFSAREIFAPLGMADTTIVDRYPARIARLARGYRRTAGGADMLCESAWEQTGDGQVHTSLRDLARWDANLASGDLGGPRLRDALLAPGQLATGRTVPYAGGLAFGWWEGHKTIGHDGAWAGYRASYLRLPQAELAVAVLANSAAFDAAALAKRLAARHVAG